MATSSSSVPTTKNKEEKLAATHEIRVAQVNKKIINDNYNNKIIII